jgi:hypothetical protein
MRFDQAVLMLSLAAAVQAPARPLSIAHDRWERPLFDHEGRRQNYTTRSFEPRPIEAPLAPSAIGEDAGAGTPETFSMQTAWRHHVYGTGIGSSGLHVVDLDGDGLPEMVAGSSGAGGFGANESWIVARRVAGALDPYTVTWRSPAGSAVRAVRIAQVDADPTPEVVVAAGAQIQVWDGASLTLQQTIPVPATVNSLAVADADGDGGLEYAACTAGAVHVFGLGGALAHTAAWPCVDVAVGQVDLDAAPEIVIANGDAPGQVVDGVTHLLEWTNAFGFGARVRLGNLDADARLEVVAASAWYHIRIFDVDLQSLTDSVTADLDIAALQLFDVEGDGPLEIVYGDGQWGEIHVLDGATRLQKWQVANPEHGVTDVALGDPDLDGQREILWGAGYSSTGPDYLYVAATAPAAIEWHSPDTAGPFLALDVAGPVGTARRALLSAAFESDSGYGDGLYHFHRVMSGAVFYRSPELTGTNWTGLTRLRAVQADADPQVEVLVATGSTYTGLLICKDSLTHAEQWRAALPDGLTIASLAVGDVDADGQLEAVVGVEVQHTGAPGVFIYVFDAATGAQEWRSPSLATGFVNLPWLRLAQFDADAQLEIAVGATNGQIYVLDRVLATTQSLGAQAVSALATFDTDGDGRDELYVGTTSGAVRRINPTTGALLLTLFNEPAGVDALAFGDLDGGGPDAVTASGNVLRARSGPTYDVLWASGPLASSAAPVVGRWDSLLLADVDGAPGLELVCNLGPTGFVVMRPGS